MFFEHPGILSYGGTFSNSTGQLCPQCSLPGRRNHVKLHHFPFQLTSYTSHLFSESSLLEVRPELGKMWILPEILSLSFLILSAIGTDAIVVKPEHSLSAPFEAGAANIVWWDLTGSAQLAETVIRLTTDEPHKQGAIWNNYPVQSMDWEVHMQFHIHGKGLHHNGDGIAIWYVRDPLQSGPVFGSKDYFSGLGVFINTKEGEISEQNVKHSYISAVVNNGSFPFFTNEHGTAGQIGGCQIPVRNLEWATRIAVSYINNVLTIFVDGYGTDQWIECFRAHEVYLPSGYFFGVSASTGELSDNHDIVSINTLDMNLPDKEWTDLSHIVPFAGYIQVPFKLPEEVPKNEVKREVKEDTTEDASGAAPVSFTRKAIYILGIGVLLYVAVKMFQRYNAQRKERMQKRLF